MNLVLKTDLSELSGDDLLSISAGGNVANTFYSSALWGVRVTGFFATVSAASAPVPAVAAVSGGLAIASSIVTGSLYGAGLLADFMGL